MSCAAFYSSTANDATNHRIWVDAVTELRFIRTLFIILARNLYERFCGRNRELFN